MRALAVEDHPRRCGENRPINIGQHNGQGSPPQVRGKQAYSSPRIEPLRITPAGAGKTALMSFRNSLPQDHPRRCGENWHKAIEVYHSLGSPPQVRGKPTMQCRRLKCSGITPAGAGKTDVPPINAIIVKDHPRRCGENYWRSCNGRYLSGSPPQVRGKRASSRQCAAQGRITPAGAGKTQYANFIPTVVQDHPRRCGENCLPSRPSRDMRGSPPQVRGKPRMTRTNNTNVRITPAGAGKTLKGDFCFVIP